MRPILSPLRVRPAAVAGAFYPAEKEVLAAQVHGLLQGDPPPARAGLKALIAPHAGYLYSGPIAAAAYRLLPAAAARLRRVVLLGPSHRIPVAGLAVAEADAFETPLGRVPIDTELRTRLLRLPVVQATDLPHAYEHSLEVQLPFLQATLGEFRLLPLAVGTAEPEAVADVLEAAWGGEDTLIIVSTDLSHYLPYSLACRIDAHTRQAIVEFSTHLTGEEACGHVGLNGLLACARRRELGIETLDLRNSGDTAGGRERVVGYGAWALYDA